MMDEPRILVQPAKQGRHPLTPAPEFGWLLLGWAGLTFAVVGGLDVALAWYPLGLGNAEWEFGTVTASLNGLPLFTMGMALLLGAAVARGRRGGVRLVAAAFVVVAVAIVLAALLWATNVPLALHSVADPAVATGLKKAIVKTCAQAIAYPVGFVWIAIKAWRHSRAS